MRNTLLTGLVLLGAGSLATAQQNVTVSGYGASQALAPIAVTGYSSSVSSGRSFKEEDLKSKEVSKEIAAPKGADIYIENSSRGIVVKTWDQQKVKVTTTVYYEGESKLTDEEWLEKTNLSLKTLGSSVKIKSGGVNGTFYSYGSSGGSINMSSSTMNGVAVFNGSGQNLGTKSNMKRVVTVTIPAGSKLDIESRYADVEVPDNIGDLNVDISNGNLEGVNLGKFILRAKYSNVNVGDVKTAEVEFMNGRFNAKNIDDLDIDSKSSTVEMASTKKLTLRSTNDEYEMEEAGEVRGRKNYGNLRITRLNTSLELDGANADIKIRNAGPSVSMIKLDDKYADVRIPLRNTKNYSIDFTGSYSSVYGNFEKKPVGMETKKDEPAGNAAPTAVGADIQRDLQRVTVLRGVSSWNDNSPSRFTAAVGDGKGLKIDIKCQNCTVDFK